MTQSLSLSHLAHSCLRKKRVNLIIGSAPLRVYDCPLKKQEEGLEETDTKLQKAAAGNALFAFPISPEMAQGKISSQWDYSQEQAI